MKHALLLIGSVLIVSLCAASPNKAFDERMRWLKPAVAKLTTTIQSRVNDENFDATITDEELLTSTINEDVFLKNRFRFLVKVKLLREKKHVSVLVCTEDERYALFEDLGCTDEVDMGYWILKDPPPCDFHLSAKWCEDSNITNGVSVDVEDGNSSR